MIGRSDWEDIPSTTKSLDPKPSCGQLEAIKSVQTLYDRKKQKFHREV
jgi:hypothetical protein